MGTTIEFNEENMTKMTTFETAKKSLKPLNFKKLARFSYLSVKEEARKQSLLASKSDKKSDAKAWEDSSDTSGWV